MSDSPLHCPDLQRLLHMVHRSPDSVRMVELGLEAPRAVRQDPRLAHVGNPYHPLLLLDVLFDHPRRVVLPGLHNIALNTLEARVAGVMTSPPTTSAPTGV